MGENFLKIVKSVAIGHAVADALGVPVEFKTRKQLSINPVTKMLGYGTYNVPKGSWSDDTSMSICALKELTQSKIDFDKIMLNFTKWSYSGEFTPTGKTFDIGNTCSYAIDNYFFGKKSYTECGLSDPSSNGNGSLMRIYPFVLYTYNMPTNVRTKIEIIEMASALTHAHERAKIACGIYAFLLWEIISTVDKSNLIDIVKNGLTKARDYYSNKYEMKRYEKLFYSIADINNEGNTTDISEIKSSGYVVDSIEAAVWCLLNTSSYSECVLKAVNLGEDTDTVGAIAGSLAGAVYGYDDIPREWLNDLIKRDYLENLCENLYIF